ncbi:hypothetical protein [Nocardioides sp.]|uniref:hypothetical protein n=1 Tax=Nocardioides sp. TaxID=35761 RepID=UPI00356A9E46
MSKRGGVPLGERRRVGGVPDAAPAVPDSTRDDCPVRHCWVADAVDRQGVKRPGLLMEWRRAGPGWQGRVLYAAQLRPGEWALVEEWLPAELLTPD